MKIRSLCCIDSVAYIDMAADFDEGDEADSVGDGGRRWRWPTVGRKEADGAVPSLVAYGGVRRM